MKKTISLALCILLVFMMFSGCQKIKPEPPVEEITPPIVEDVKPDPKPEVTPNPGTEEKSELEQLLPIPIDKSLHLSYEEYFSVERSYESVYNTVFSIIDLDGIKSAVYMKSFSKENEDYLVVYAKKNVSWIALNTNHIFIIAEDKEIIMFDYSMKEEESLFISEEPIDQMYVGNDVLFFRKGDSVCRLYLPSGQVDIIFTNKDISDNLDTSSSCTRENKEIYSYYKPISSTDIRWDKLLVDCVHDTAELRKNYDLYVYSDLTKKSYYVTEEAFGYKVNTTYLMKRAEDLEKMGVDPYTISFRKPEDTIF